MASGCKTHGVILVVDDEPGVRLLVKRILEPAGYEVIEAAHGQEALNLIESGAHVDFLVVDLAMPVMGGQELAERLREVRPELRVLFVTGQSDRLFACQSELNTGEAFLDKPFTGRGLIEAVSLLKNGYIVEPPRHASVMTQLLQRLVSARP